MFNNFFASLKLSQNIEKVKTTITSTFTVITKIISLLNHINEEFTISAKLKAYLPAILSSLVAVASIIEKIAPLLGLTLVKGQATAAADLSAEELLAELNKSVADLNDLLK
jgi:hypothetical protein